MAHSLSEERPEYDWGENVEEDEQPWRFWQKKVCGEVGIDRDDLRLALGRIRSSGLVDEVLVGGDEETFTVLTPEANKIVPYRVSSAFEKMMRFLQPNE